MANLLASSELQHVSTLGVGNPPQDGRKALPAPAHMMLG